MLTSQVGNQGPLLICVCYFELVCRSCLGTFTMRIVRGLQLLSDEGVGPDQNCSGKVNQL